MLMDSSAAMSAPGNTRLHRVLGRVKAVLLWRLRRGEGAAGHPAPPEVAGWGKSVPLWAPPPPPWGAGSGERAPTPATGSIVAQGSARGTPKGVSNGYLRVSVHLLQRPSPPCR